MATAEQKQNAVIKIQETSHYENIDDIKFLVDKFFEFVETKKMSNGDAKRLTYACLYRQSDIQFNPQARILELKGEK